MDTMFSLMNETAAAATTSNCGNVCQQQPAVSACHYMSVEAERAFHMCLATHIPHKQNVARAAQSTKHLLQRVADMLGSSHHLYLTTEA
jgi:hypothetical protein